MKLNIELYLKVDFLGTGVIIRFIKSLVYNNDLDSLNNRKR